MEEVIDKDKKTILIVDDEQHIVDILVYNLEKEVQVDISTSTSFCIKSSLFLL